jgi:hypothetical protein
MFVLTYIDVDFVCMHSSPGCSWCCFSLWYYVICLLLGFFSVYYILCVVYWCEGVTCTFVLIRVSNMGFCVSVNVSFIYRPIFVRSYIWNLSNVYSLGRFPYVVFSNFGLLCHNHVQFVECVVRIFSFVSWFWWHLCVLYTGPWMFISFVWYILVDILHIVIVILHIFTDTHNPIFDTLIRTNTQVTPFHPYPQHQPPTNPHQ